MSDARRPKGLLAAAPSLALIELVRSRRSGQWSSQAQVLMDFSASYPGMWSRAANTLDTLVHFGVCLQAGDAIQLSPAWDQDGDRIRRQLSLSVATTLAETAQATRTSFLRFHGPDGGLCIDSFLLPRELAGLQLWVIEFGIGCRESAASRLWRVDEAFHSILLGATRAANAAKVIRMVSLAELEHRLESNSVHGREAEDWVLDFERDRLKGHPLLDQVRRISDEYVNAGFDIVSFLSVTSISLDLFIEVKSFSANPHFYWSRNEIAVARARGEEYALYLVDRSRMDSPGYSPQVIPGPYTALFESRSNGWSFEPSTFEFAMQKEH